MDILTLPALLDLLELDCEHPYRHTNTSNKTPTVAAIKPIDPELKLVAVLESPPESSVDGGPGDGLGVALGGGGAPGVELGGGLLGVAGAWHASTDTLPTPAVSVPSGQGLHAVLPVAS